MNKRIESLAKSSYNHLRQNSSLILVCILIALSHLLYHGYQFGDWNHGIQIPILKSYFHPELYPNDAMVATRSHFITFYFLFLALIERIFGHLETILFIGFIITETLFFIAVYHFAYAVFKERNVAIIAIALFFTGKLIIGGDIIHWNHNNHTHAVLPLIMFSFVLFLKGRNKSAYGLLGFCANIHIQSVAYVLPMFALVSFVGFLKNRKATGFRDGMTALLKDYGFFVLFALPCLIWAFSKSGEPLTPEWILQLRARSSHHSFPLSWAKRDFTEYLFLFTFGVILWFIAFKNSQDKQTHWKFFWFAVVVLAFCGISIIFAEFLPIKIILRVQLFRSTKFLTIFIVLYSCYVINYLSGKSSLHKILALGTFLVLFFAGYSKFMILLLPIYLFAEHKGLNWGIVVFVTAVLILRVFTPHDGFPSKFNTDEIVLFIRPFFEDKLRATLMLLLIFWLAVKMQMRKWLTYTTAGIIVLIICIYIVPSIYQRVAPPHENRGNWIAAQLWAKENTPLDAMFIIPPYLQGFRVFSERGVVADWKDGTQQYFDTQYSYIWWERICDLGKNDKNVYDNLSTERLSGLCKKYNATHIVFPASKTLDLPISYENKEFRIYTCK